MISTTSTTTWVCDRCGLTVQVDGPADTVEGWKSVLVAEAHLQSHAKRNLDLCGGCHDAFTRWMVDGVAKVNSPARPKRDQR